MDTDFIHWLLAALVIQQSSDAAGIPQDPNWFYSSISQSAAAVIGVLGAVLVSRLLQAVVDGRRNAERVIDTFVSVGAGLVSRQNEIRGYAAFLAREAPLVGNLLAEAATSRQINSWQEFGMSTGGSAWNQELSPDMLKGLETDAEACNLILSSLPPVITLVRFDGEALRHAELSLRTVALDCPERARTMLEGHANGLKDARSVYADHRRALDPSLSVTMLIVLAWLAVSGVLAPLIYVYAGPNPVPKTALLAAFALGILGFLLYLGSLVRDLMRLRTLELPESARLPSEA
jgi:hypothetical protein